MKKLDYVMYHGDAIHIPIFMLNENLSAQTYGKRGF